MKKIMDNEVKYDAFISYRHCEPDSLIAEALHKKLEHYHIPRVVQQFTGRKKISRIFRDKEELPLSSNLTDNIYEALDHSEFLILICSPESMKSIWVQREVEYFVNKHGKEHVLTVLVRGEPEDAFPRLLCEDIQNIEDEGGTNRSVIVQVEPLAADVRGKNIKESLKKLNSEILRLLAAMLGCSYDSLKQRHREYIIKRTVSVSGLVFLCLLGFGGYSKYQKEQIELQRKKSLQSQAEYLSEKSIDALKSGNREEALRKAIEISQDEDACVSPKQLYALNSALYSFKSGAWIEYAPEYTSEVNNITDGVFSEDGRFYYAVNDMKEGFILSGETGKLLWKIDTERIDEMISKERDSYDPSVDVSEIQLILPYQEDTFLVVLEYAACIINADSHEIIRIFPMSTGNVNIDSYSLDGDTFAICSDQNDISIYDLSSGKPVAQIDTYSTINYDIDEIFNYRENLNISINEKKSTVAVGVSWDGQISKEGKGLCLYDYEKNTVRFLSDIQTERVVFINDAYIGVIHREVPDVQKQGMDGRGYYTYFLSVYDAESGELLYTSEKITTLQEYYMGLAFEQFSNNSEETIHSVIGWLENQIIVTDLNTGTVLGQLDFDADILGIRKMGEDSFLVGTASGWFQKVVLTDSIFQFDIMEVSSTIEKFSFSENTNRIVTLENGRAVFCSNTSDTHMTKCGVADDKNTKITDIEYIELNDSVYRCVRLKKSGSFGITDIALYDISSDECIYYYACENENNNISKVELFSKNNEIYMYLIEDDGAYGTASVFYVINLSTKKEVVEIDLLEKDIDANSIIFSQDHSTMIGETERELAAFNISETEIEKIPIIEVDSGEEISACGKLSDRDGVVFIIEDYFNEEEDAKLFMYDISSGNLQNINIHINSADKIKMVTGKKSSRICVYSEDMFYVIDGDNGNVLSQITLMEKISKDTSVDFDFFNEDNYLLVTYGNTVFMYNALTANLVDSLMYDTSDALLNIYAPTLKLITDSSSSYFALKDASFMSSMDRNMNKQLLYVFSVDTDMKMYPYAEVGHGYASLSGEEIAVRSIYDLDYASFYDYEELKEKAEKILDGSE